MKISYIPQNYKLATTVTSPTPQDPNLLGFLSNIDWQALYEKGKYTPPNSTTVYDWVMEGLRQSVRAIRDSLVMLFIKGYASSYWVAYILILFGIVTYALGFKKGKKVALGTLLFYSILCALGKAMGWEECIRK